MTSEGWFTSGNDSLVGSSSLVKDSSLVRVWLVGSMTSKIGEPG